MNKMIEYHLNKGALPPLTSSLGFDYVIAGNGIFVRAENKFHSTVMLIAPGVIKGLLPLNPHYRLKLDSIPSQLMERIMVKIPYEQMFHVRWNGEKYYLTSPHQSGDVGSVSYYEPDQSNIVMEIHTHPKHGAWFSSQDDRDEKGFRLYGVVDPYGATAESQIAVRLGVYGYYYALEPHLVFDGLPLKNEEEHIYSARSELQGRLWDVVSRLVRSLL